MNFQVQGVFILCGEFMKSKELFLKFFDVVNKLLNHHQISYSDTQRDYGQF